jgi:hypothetical protein
MVPAMNTPQNPPRNQLGPGVTTRQVTEAVRTSGYPLQTKVAAILDSPYRTFEEWAYRDEITGATRTLDLFADRDFWPPPSEDSRVRPKLNLLIECKQSDLPYVFFVQRNPTVGIQPTIAGLPSDEIVIKTDDDRSSWIVPLLSALSLNEHPFLQHATTAAAISKCVRKGHNLTLSGDESYNALIRPLASAVHFLGEQAQPRPSYQYFEPRLVLLLGIVDAPMLAVQVREHDEVIEPAPWVRVVHHRPPQLGEHTYGRGGKPAIIDVVHFDFLGEYLDKHVVPFMEDFAERAIRHHEELATGRGFARKMGSQPREDIERRLMPRTRIPNSI